MAVEAKRIGEIITEKPFAMAFVEDDDVIQTLPANATDDARGVVSEFAPAAA